MNEQQKAEEYANKWIVKAEEQQTFSFSQVRRENLKIAVIDGYKAGSSDFRHENERLREALRQIVEYSDAPADEQSAAMCLIFETSWSALNPKS
jgi:hypothetical protein